MMKVSEIMTPNPITINEKEKVKVAAKIMTEKGISVLPVVNDADELQGIVTESDFIGKEVEIPHALASIKQLFGQNFYFDNAEDLYSAAKEKVLANVMTKAPKTIHPDTTVSEMVNYMIKNNLKRIPITGDDGKLLGIVTRKDIMKAFAK